MISSIITLANRPVEIAFQVMVRSLRAVGCELPVRVIPYDEQKFDLPDGCEWWEDDKLFAWLDRAATPGHASKVMRKYLCLLHGEYQFVDADVVWLRNPQEVLAPHTGFVTSCGHWHNPGDTVTAESRALLAERSTLWPAKVFNSGQFACDRALYSFDELQRAAEDPQARGTVLQNRFHEQAGMNLLVNLSKVPVTNLTLPPCSMESTWAGDYAGDPERYWGDSMRKPYLMHWAGMNPNGSRPVDDLFFDYLTPDEREVWSSEHSMRSPRISPMERLRFTVRAARREWKRRTY